MSRRFRTSWVVGSLLLMLMGCTRRYYRNFADRDTYRIEQDRNFDWRWRLPDRPVEAHPDSRIGDRHDPNREPIPPDDPAARPFQVSAGRPFEFAGWKQRGTAPVEDLSWLGCVPRQPDGKVLLTKDTAVRIALMNSRDYQTQVENVYLAALSLTLTRFNFFPQFASNQSTDYLHTGAKKNATDQLQLFTQNTLSWTFYSGANLLVNLSNSLVFEYNGTRLRAVNTPLLISLTQPLLRGAWARNVTQPLSLQERAVLYAVRSFAEFRRQFYVNVVSGYYTLLLQLQQIRNQEYQLEQLKRNLDELDASTTAGLADPLQRDITASQYQNARIALLGIQANFQTQLDLYRINLLGLPADFPLDLDESLLNRFELNDTRLDALKKGNDTLYLALLQYDQPPPREVMAEAARTLLREFRQLRDVSTQVGTELARWRARIEAKTGKSGTGPGPTEQDERESLRKQSELVRELSDGYQTSVAALDDNIGDTNEYLEKLGKADPVKAFEAIRQELVSRDFRARLAEQFLIENQVRVYLIDVNPVELTVPQAVGVALANRLDLMNGQAIVTDSWRNVEFDANQLLAGLNLTYQANLNTAPGKHTIFGFDAHEGSQLVGLQFQAPIVRRGQRNIYRADQINFQRARRGYMLLHDNIVQQIRADMRNLNLDRRQFEISRVALLLAARQVDSAEYNARNLTGASSGGGQVVGQNLNTAVNNLLNAKNGLITNWVQYEIGRISLFRDFDIMNIDDNGVWTNDTSVPSFHGAPVASYPDPVGAPVESLLPGPARRPEPSGGGTGTVLPELPPLPPPPTTPGPFARP